MSLFIAVLWRIRGAGDSRFIGDEMPQGRSLLRSCDFHDANEESYCRCYLRRPLLAIDIEQITFVDAALQALVDVVRAHSVRGTSGAIRIDHERDSWRIKYRVSRLHSKQQQYRPQYESATVHHGDCREICEPTTPGQRSQSIG